MSINHLPFYLRITTANSNLNLYKIDLTPQTVYSSFYYPDDAIYQIIAPITPCDAVLFSPSKLIKGKQLNKKFITKDDLYQYHLNHNESKVLQFTYVFNEILSNTFIKDKIIFPNKDIQNVFVFGRKKLHFIQEMIWELMTDINELKISFYIFNEETKEKTLISPSLSNISIFSFDDITNAIINMKNEYKMYIINKHKDINDMEDNDEDQNKIFIITAQCQNEEYYFMTCPLNDDSMSEVNKIINADMNYTSSFVLNIFEQSEMDIERIKIFSRLYSQQKNDLSNSTMKKNKKLKTNKTDPNILKTASCHSRNATIPNKLTNEGVIEDYYNTAENNNNSYSFVPIDHHHNKINTIITNHDSPQRSLNMISILPLENDIDMLKDENKLLENLNKKLAESLEQERRGKLELINENCILNNKLIESQKDNEILVENFKQYSMNEQRLYEELTSKEMIENDLKNKDNYIKQLLEDKEQIETQYTILNEKYELLKIDLKQCQSKYKQLNQTHDISLKEIEHKVNTLENELGNFQKENIILQSIKEKQGRQIDKINKEKEKYYTKYKALKEKMMKEQDSYIGMNIGITNHNIKQKDTTIIPSQQRLIDNLRQKINKFNTDLIK